MPKKIEVVPYDTNWLKIFEAESAIIKEALGDNFLAIHHVGSTSVPHLAAKPKIDIIAVVRDLLFAENQLTKQGHISRGGFNLPLRRSFDIKDKKADFNLHVFEENDPEIELNILFRDYLRCSPEARSEYEKLKYQLIAEESSHEKLGPIYTGYTLGKHNFIQNILKKSGFNKHRFVLCTHYSEWEHYHRIRKEQIFDPINVEYDPNHPTINAPLHFHLILYKGINIVAVAHIEFLSESDAVLRSLATDAPYQTQGFGKEMMILLEKWIKIEGRQVIKMHARPSAENFYRKLGYKECDFDDQCIQGNYIDLGKRL